MNIKQKLLQTLNGLEMSMKWKNQFVDTLIEVLELEEKDDDIENNPGDDSVENNTGSAVKEGDVLYYTMVDTTVNGLLNIVSSKNSGNLLAGITQLAVSNCMNENSGNSYFNQFWDSWTLNQHNTIKNGSLIAENIAAVKFTVGADNKDLIAVSNSDKDITNSERYFTQITEEEYNNIFN